MSEEPCPFKIGDRVVLIWQGPDQPEAVVTRINASRTCPTICTISVAYDSGKFLTLCPTSLRPASEKCSMPVARNFQDTYPASFVSSAARAPILGPDWTPDDLSKSSLAEAVADWERSVEYTLDLFNRECVHAYLHDFERQGLTVPEPLAERIALADQRFIESTSAGSSVYPEWDHDPEAFWYYFRWLRS